MRSARLAAAVLLLAIGVAGFGCCKRTTVSRPHVLVTVLGVATGASEGVAFLAGPAIGQLPKRDVRLMPPVEVWLTGEGFVPRNTVARVGQQILVRLNTGEQPLRHVCHAVSDQLVGTLAVTGKWPFATKLRREELFVLIGCDVHPEERAFVSCFEHDATSTIDAEGTFRIAFWSPPDTSYELRVVSRSGETRRRLTVSSLPEQRIELRIKGSDPEADPKQ